MRWMSQTTKPTPVLTFAAQNPQNMISYTPSEMETSHLHGLLLSAIAPRPIAFVSTVDADGRPNLAPFSFFNVFSAAPPIAIFSPARRVRGNTTKHSLDNVEITRECVINVVSYAMLHQVNLASCEFDRGVNEFEKAGFTALASDMVKPMRVKEAPVQLECKVREIIHLGEEGGAGNLVISEVVRMHVSEDVLGEDGNIDPQKLDLVARMGQNWYCRAHGSAVFEVPKPSHQAGIGIDTFPENVRNSTVLTGNDLGKLGMVSALPTEAEVRAYSKSSNKNLKVAHTIAHIILKEGKTMEAWKVLLSAELD